jgi:hypothetical protein
VKLYGSLGNRKRAGDLFMVSQIVVVDRTGVIRVQSRPVREANVEDESYLRNLIDGLLREGAPAASAQKGKGPHVQANTSN